MKSVSGAAILPTSVGLQRQNGSPRKPDGNSAKPQAGGLPGYGVVISGTPRALAVVEVSDWKLEGALCENSS
jgi:hypothetical protein